MKCTTGKRQYFFTAVSASECLSLVLYRETERLAEIPFDPAFRVGNVWELWLSETELRASLPARIPEDRLRYCFSSEKGDFADPRGKLFYGNEQFGAPENGTRLLTAPLRSALFRRPASSSDSVSTAGDITAGNRRKGKKEECVPEGWEEEVPLRIPYEELVVYRLHVRGFTAHSSSGLSKRLRGTFLGLKEKLPYLKELGINAVELMPVYDFNEILLTERSRPMFPLSFERTGGGDKAGAHRGEAAGAAFAGAPEEAPAQRAEEYRGGTLSVPSKLPEKAIAAIRERIPTGRINYWGFTEDARYMAPKSAYAAFPSEAEGELRELIRAMHRAGIEVILDLYVTPEQPPQLLSEVIRYWRTAYHIDGIHFVGMAPVEALKRDPYLAGMKLWADRWGTLSSPSMGDRVHCPRCFGEYNEDFQNTLRCILKGDEGMLPALMGMLRENPEDRGTLHFFANVTGFSLWDMLSYDRKHNEENGENNRDGTDQNFSWNCGEEGKSRRRSVQQLRHRLWKNAWLLLFLSQGTPLFVAGDEFGMSHGGNNNPYCQDNAVNWLNWRLCEKNAPMLRFVRSLIAFRRAHGVFRQRKPLQLLDYRAVGVPDLSFHGEAPWQPETEPFRRQLGAMYSGAYAGDDTFLVLFNFHWEKHRFSLPHAPLECHWAKLLDTAENRWELRSKEEEELLTENEVTLEPRSILLLRASSEGEAGKEAGRTERKTPKKQRRRRNGQGDAHSLYIRH